MAKLTMEQLAAQLAEMQAKAEAAEKRATEAEARAAEAVKGRKTGGTGISMQVAAKGGISIYGVQRRPVTLYAGQWHRLFPQVDALKALIIAERDTLAWKSTADKTAVLRSLGYDGPVTEITSATPAPEAE